MKSDHLILSRNTTIAFPETPTVPVRNALGIFARDFAKVFGAAPLGVGRGSADIVLTIDPDADARGPESFSIDFSDGAGSAVSHVTANDELGLIYALLHLSEHWLGVDPFWFWADREPQRLETIAVPARAFRSPKRRVRYRGWFVNDEVCLIGWTEIYPPPAEIWKPVFETLLRLGGNLVIPGTDLPRDGVQTAVAAEMGLHVSHHHAEPLGAEMFFRAHPDQEASFDRNGALFEALWREAIERQKDQRVVWALGFRGQGDCPFWEQDPAYDTPERQGALISRAVQRQYDLLQAILPGAPCLTYVYGEIAELYRAGHIEFPPGVMRIWSDNGYGRMVSRRQHNHSLRVPSLPEPQDQGPHGIYYHATFHDLQASSHLTMLPVASSLIIGELQAAFAAGADALLLVNCGNVRPHLYTLDLIAQLWNHGYADAALAPSEFAGRYFPQQSEAVSELIRRHIACAIAYGPHDDDRAGDEFYHHPARSLAGHVMRGETDRTAEDLIWATGRVSLRDQARWFEEHAAAAAERYRRLEQDCDQLAQSLAEDQAVFFRDFLLFQTRFHRSSAQGLSFLANSILAFLDGAYPQAFVHAAQSVWAYRETLSAMENSEHGKWQHFFRADWLTNVKITLYTVESLRSFYRMFGDGPDFFLWHKAYLMPEREKKIYLENTHRNPPSDDALAQRLKVHFGM
ncbi:glycosyl hydrolase 115 family protein [Martelella sp. HB161492]|uniref:glycosyl hydrolase 115 family protein n=1 Tax=Martelella sp. HB161492 TaxID=2720726 RepID=UPI001591E41B|nr:glycosyl hydrolase 115 family protein [Martelella sp. HB161492]